MRTLLTAHWVNLLTATYETNKNFLKKFLPAKTELNDWNGKYMMSLVGFMFLKPVLLGIPSPIYRSFEEINLRFYVRHKEKKNWKNGVVFIKEIAPARIIGLTAAWIYKENFISLPMKHDFYEDNESRNIKYACKTNHEWKHFYLKTTRSDSEPGEESIESFIRDHYLGYTKAGRDQTMEFQVEHRPWKIFPSQSFEMNLDIKNIYGDEFEEYFAQTPLTSFLMDGSFTKVSWPVLL